MEIEEQVLSVEQMQNLKKLGVEVKDASFAWCVVFKDVLGNMLKESIPCLLIEPPTDKELDKYEGWSTIIPTLTLQEILKLLPYDMTWDTWQWQIDHCGENMEYNDGDGYCSHRETKGSLLDKAYNMLCWVAEKWIFKHIEFDAIKQRMICG